MEADRPDKEKVSDWFLETAKKCQLFDYGPAKGTIVIRPYGYSIWEKVQAELNARISAAGAENAYFPLLFPYSFLVKEKEHVEGFSPELAVVTQAGGQALDEFLVVRPTSETVIYDLFSKWTNSWRDLPLRINQWANVVRWEMRPFPFLRTTEFLWQEGHTAHASAAEAEAEADKILTLYRDFFQDFLALPVVTGQKSDREKFAGAVYSLSCEAMLMDGRALQIATVHNLGQKFSRSFNVRFQDKTGRIEHVWQTSWGFSTRAMGGMLMIHGDRKGFILPPAVAPWQAVIIPIIKANDSGLVQEKCENLERVLRACGVRVKIDFRDQTPGWKFNDWEVKGVPLRIEIGSRELSEERAVCVLRDRKLKFKVDFDEIGVAVTSQLRFFQERLLDRAIEFLSENTNDADDYGVFSELLSEKKGFVRSLWCGDAKCESAIKQETKASNRTVGTVATDGRCIYCQREAKYLSYWAKAH